MSLPDHVFIDAWQYTLDGMTPVRLPVSAEYSVRLSINGNAFLNIACSGSDLSELALGHLLSEGIIRSPDEVLAIEVDDEMLTVNIATKMSDEILERLFRIHSIASGCGQGRTILPGEEEKMKILTPPLVRAERIVACMREFLQSSDLHLLTHGVHSAALCSLAGERIAFFDEIGRHNAVDKVIGFALARGLSLEDKMILSTGRLSSEIIYKAVYASAPVIISRASPTSLSLELARRFGILMIGKFRAGTFSVFHGADRIMTEA